MSSQYENVARQAANPRKRDYIDLTVDDKSPSDRGSSLTIDLTEDDPSPRAVLVNKLRRSSLWWLQGAHPCKRAKRPAPFDAKAACRSASKEARRAVEAAVVESALAPTKEEEEEGGLAAELEAAMAEAGEGEEEDGLAAELEAVLAEAGNDEEDDGLVTELEAALAEA